jgi:dienelactone hydrolase
MKFLQFKAGFSYSAFQIFLVLLLLLISAHEPVKAQTPIKAPPQFKMIQGNTGARSWVKFSDAHNALYKYLAGQAYDILDQRARSVAKLHSLSDWKKRQQWAKQTLEDVIGPFPPKTPLHARITKTVNKKVYRVENIIYQSQPGFYVTSSLFIPDDIETPAPAVLYCSGHIPSAYRSDLHQRFILNMVKKGFIVFAFDPVGQGERQEYYNPMTGKSIFNTPMKQHTYPGAQAFITGSSIARYMIWDGIRAVDYLLSRKEVDPKRIGITGGSGGGMQTAIIGALDDRIYAAAPERWITSFTRLLETIGPQDADQDLPNEIGSGLDQADFLEIRAPKPTLMVTVSRDFFSPQGSIETAKEVRRIYKAYGKPENFAMVKNDGTHHSNEKNREARYAFFQKFLDNPGSSKEVKVEPLSSQELQVTCTGQLATSSLKTETVFSLNSKKAEKEAKKLRTSAKKNINRYLSRAVQAAKKLSGYRQPDSIGQPVLTGSFDKNGYVIYKYFIKEAGKYPIPYLLLAPDKPNGKAVIYLDSYSKAVKIDQEKWLARKGYTVLSPDLLGVGETAPQNIIGSGYYPWKGGRSPIKIINSKSYVPWFVSVLNGGSIVGLQAREVVRFIRLMQNRSDVQKVYGLARGQMGPVLLHAAAFDSSIDRVALIGMYSSYRSIATTRFYLPKFIASTVSGALQAYDLPDLAASLAPRKLLITGLVDGTGHPADSKDIDEDTAVIKMAYRHKNAREQLKIIPWRSVVNPHNLLKIFTTWNGKAGECGARCARGRYEAE